MHLVLIRFSSLGDVVMQTSLVNFLKQKFPAVTITFVSSTINRVFLEDHPAIDNLILLDKKRGKEDFLQLKKIACDIKSMNPDLILDLHNTLRSKFIRLITPTIPSVTINKRSFLRKLLVQFKLDYLKKLPPQHIRLIDDFSVIFNYAQNTSFNLPLSSIAQSYKIKPENKYGDYIAIAPVASFDSKRWSIDSFNELLNLLLSSQKFENYKFIILGGPEDKYCQSILVDERVINLQGKTSLGQTNELVQNSKFVVSNDTGVAHIAEAFNKPAIVMFGATSPSFGFRPHLKKSTYFYRNIACSPCSVTGSEKCKQSKHLCMLEITPNEVFSCCEKTLGSLDD